jgi:DNA-binding LytR/AlgR family response regulator
LLKRRDQLLRIRALVVAMLAEQAACYIDVIRPQLAANAIQLLDWDELHFARADGDYCRVHTYDRSYLCTKSLRELEETLPGDRFARIHRSYLVNLGKVAAIRRPASDRLRLTLDDAERTELDVARRQSKAVRERLRV